MKISKLLIVLAALPVSSVLAEQQTFSVSSKPDGASIFINGQDTGIKTPGEVTVDDAAYQHLELFAEGHLARGVDLVTKRGNVTVSHNKEVSIRLTPADWSETQKEAAAHREKLAEAQKAIADAQSKLDALAGERDKANANAAELQSRLEAMTGERDRANAVISDLQAKLGDAQRASDAGADAAKRTVEALQSRLAALEGELSAARDNVHKQEEARLLAEKAAALATENANRALSAGANSAAADAAAKVAALKDAKAARDAAAKSDAELAKIRDELLVAKNVVQKAREATDAAAGRARDAAEALGRAEGRASAAEARAQEAERSCAKIEGRLLAAEARIRALAASADSAPITVADREAVLRGKFQALQKRLEENQISEEEFQDAIAKLVNQG